MNEIVKSTNTAMTPAQTQVWNSGAEQIRVYERKTVENAAKVGKLLIQIKDQLGHGHFGAWLKHIGWTNSTAQNHMNVALHLGDKIPTVGNLKLGEVYKIAALPADRRNEALNLITDPENPPVAAINTVLDAAQRDRQLARLQKQQEKNDQRKTPAGRKAAEARKKKERERAEAEQRARDKALAKLQERVMQWVGKLAPEMAEELAEMIAEGLGYQLVSTLEDALTAPAQQIVQPAEVTPPKQATPRQVPDCEDADYEEIPELELTQERAA